jgi:Mg-chelatase subunit ChlD
MADRSDFNNVDIGFIVDVTGSMGPFLNSAKRNLKNMLDTFAKQRGVDIRAGLVEFQDFCDESSSFLIRKQMLTHDLDKVHDAIANMHPGGGGDIPEAVYDAVEAAASLRWNEKSLKVAVLVGDAPPHAAAAHIFDEQERRQRKRLVSDTLIDGSPSGITLHSCTAALEEKGIVLFAIVVSSERGTLETFGEIASYTGGKAYDANSAELAVKEIGRALKMELDQLDVDWQVYEAMQELRTDDTSVVGARLGMTAFDVTSSVSRLSKRGFTADIDD